MRLVFTALFATVIVPALAAEPFAARDWRFRQELPVAQAALVKVALPIETLDAARPDLADLRIIGPNGIETPFAIDRARPAMPHRRAAEKLTTSVEDAAMVFVLKTGTDERVTALEIDAGQQSFLTRATVEASNDGQEWRLLGRNLPVYDRGGQLRALWLNLPPNIYPYLRVSLDRLGDRHIALQRISLVTESVPTEEPELIAVRVVARDEIPGETRLTLALPGANLWIATLQLTTPEPVFSRPARLAYRVFENEAIREINLAETSMVRAKPIDQSGSGDIAMVVNRIAPLRELTLVVENGDSPPLVLSEISARRLPVYAVFYAATEGSHRIYVGNPKALPPRYDVGTLDAGSPTWSPLRLSPAPLDPNPEFRPSEPLPEIPALGAALDVAPWAYRKSARIGAGGVQQLELDPAVLGHAQPELGDLRLMSDGRQVPFIMERTGLTRPLAVQVTSVPDPKQLRLSRWRLTLPQTRLPLTRLTAAVSTPVFQRDMRLFEKVEDQRGYVAQRWLGQASWSQTPERRTAAFGILVNQILETDTLWIETDNADNPPIALGEVRAHYGVTRLLFKATDSTPMFLYYGNPQAAMPRYDLSLVGSQLLSADKGTPSLGMEESLKAPSLAATMALAGRSGLLFWGVLALVVVLLLLVIARLLPKASLPPK